ncbi:MAG TPA: Nudix family hydrolase [Sedimenticola sp.]|nr:Nudix family hydrolase [Sedimenticola sp.]
MTVLHVAVAVIEDGRGRVLIGRRPAHAHQGGLWEFPGGKLEPGETLSQALKREVREELGLEVRAHRPLIRITHHYPDRSVLLDAHRVTSFTGAAEGREGQPLAWVRPEELGRYPLPPADGPIAMALQLPDRYLITGADPADRGTFLGRLERALEGGIGLVQLRARSLPADEFRRLAEAALGLCRRYGARLLLNASPGLARALGADGVHLSARQLGGLRKRPPGGGLLVAASCHNAAELARAAGLGLDFAVLSPVLPTASHPQARPLGWERFSDLAGEALLPVYALGGMRVGMIARAQDSGAQGIAGISGLWPE